MHGCELRSIVSFIQYMYVIKSGIDGNVNVNGFTGKVLSLQSCVRQWEFVRLFVLSYSGDVSCFAFFKPYSYILYLQYTLLLCC